MTARDLPKLLAIVGLGVVVRFFTLWLGRPEFTGWLNHTYYYFVQVRELVEGNPLPYADMPLLFEVYALGARLLIAFGLEPADAVVASTRIVMCFVPALVAVPVYLLAARLNEGRPLRPAQWGLVAVAAFLPLSVSYIPEYLQKNAVGLLLLASLIVVSHRCLGRPVRWLAMVGAGVLIAVIVTTHYGTTAALILWAVALTLALSKGRSPRRAATSWVGLGLFSVLVVGAIYRLEPARFERLFAYASSSLSNSLVGGLVTGERDRLAAFGGLAFVLALWAVVAASYRLCTRSEEVPERGRTFWLANVLLCCLLFLPIVDEQLMARLGLFASVPLLFILLQVERYGRLAPRWRKVGVGLLLVGTVLLAFGEVMSARVRNTDHEGVLADLWALAERVELSDDDLVLTRTGAEHVCNWFYDVKAGVITSLELGDFRRYEHVYVFNVLDGRAVPRIDSGPIDEATRYEYMRADIPRPAQAVLLFETERLELFELQGPPSEWEFDEGGRWVSYGGAP